MLRAESVSKHFENNAIIDDVTFDVGLGDFIGILGESGSGKSTLLYLLSGLLKPTAGQVYLGEKEITHLCDGELSNFRLVNFGFIFQSFNLLSGLSVIENMEVPLILSNKNQRCHRDYLNSLLDMVGLADCSSKKVDLLSGGQQQRVAIARALVNKPSVIFADEPTGSLDSRNTKVVIDLMGMLKKECNTTILMVTHSDKTLSYCNRVVHIVDGRIEE